MCTQPITANQAARPDTKTEQQTAEPTHSIRSAKTRQGSQDARKSPTDLSDGRPRSGAAWRQEVQGTHCPPPYCNRCPTPKAYIGHHSQMHTVASVRCGALAPRAHLARALDASHRRGVGSVVIASMGTSMGSPRHQRFARPSPSAVHQPPQGSHGPDPIHRPSWQACMLAAIPSTAPPHPQPDTACPCPYCRLTRHSIRLA